ncbi:hypothetical protein ACHAXH_006705 [Discostella pseudostelligera]
MDGAVMDNIQRAAVKMRLSDSPIKTTSNTSNPKGTLYITVGPQCAGKTTILKHIFGKSFHKNEEGYSELSKEMKYVSGIDITIDDQELVYIPVLTNYFLQCSTSNVESGDGASHDLPRNQVIYEKSIEDRIRDPSNQELILVLQRLRGIISAEEFVMRLSGDEDNKGSVSVREDLISAAEQIIKLHQCGRKEENDDQVPAEPLPKMIDLFIVESVFRPRPLELMQKMTNEESNSTHKTSSSVEALSAIDQAQHLLKIYATNSLIHSPMASISWGNTNTRPREFQAALEAASLSGRPVEFIAFGGMEACNMIRDHVSRREYRKSHGNKEISVDDYNDEIHGKRFLPKVDRRTLYVRNLQRFLETGRYIPSIAINDAMIRVESILAQAVAEAIKKEYPVEKGDIEKVRFCSAKFQLDFELAKLAGYHMNADRTVSLSKQCNESSPNNKRHQSRRHDDRNPQRAGRYQGKRSYFGNVRHSKTK